MKATIWHNPKCGTSRKTLAILENLSKINVTVVEYLKEPPSKDKLKQLYACLLYTSPSPRDQRGSRMPSSA